MKSTNDTRKNSEMQNIVKTLTRTVKELKDIPTVEPKTYHIKANQLEQQRDYQDRLTPTLQDILALDHLSPSDIDTIRRLASKHGLLEARRQSIPIRGDMDILKSNNERYYGIYVDDMPVRQVKGVEIEIDSKAKKLFMTRLMQALSPNDAVSLIERGWCDV